MQHLESIHEASYLSVPNSPLYRKIMRFFYREYEKMHFQLYKEDVFEFIKAEPEYADYTMEKLNLDLDALVAWKNLTPIQDPGRVYTIADYKNKQFRYTMSEYAVEIERLTVRLENLFMESGNLSTNYFVRLKKGLNEADKMSQASFKDINEWWHMLQEDFKRLNQNYQDYLREFYSGKSEHLLKSVEFVMHKDKFIKYLNDFVQELQHHSRDIEVILNQMIPIIEEKILEKVVQSELDIPHAMLEKNGDLEPSIRENVWGKWTSLKNWFIDTPEHECECQKVLKITNDTIRSIIQNAALIVQMQNWGISRKDDYRKFLEMFLECEDLDEAHRLAAHVFGIQNIHHLRTVEGRDSDAINQSVYDEHPMEYVIKPHTRSYREKKDRQGFTDKTLEKWSQRNDYLQKVQQEKELVLHYIKNNKIIFSEIDEVVSEHTKNVFLQWITQANMNSQRKGRTEYGQEYQLKKTDGTCILECEDGRLTMPAYVMEFQE